MGSVICVTCHYPKHQPVVPDAVCMREKFFHISSKKETPERWPFSFRHCELVSPLGHILIFLKGYTTLFILVSRATVYLQFDFHLHSAMALLSLRSSVQRTLTSSRTG